MHVGYTAPGTLQRFGKFLDDTATWLHRLVFALETLSVVLPSTTKPIRGRRVPVDYTEHATEGDADKEEAEEAIAAPPRRSRKPSPPALDSHWEIGTSLVDELLENWTCFSPEQVRVTTSRPSEEESGTRITEI